MFKEYGDRLRGKDVKLAVLPITSCEAKRGISVLSHSKNLFEVYHLFMHTRKIRWKYIEEVCNQASTKNINETKQTS